MAGFQVITEDHAGQPTAAGLLRCCLCADARLTAARVEGHGVGAGPSHHHPSATVEDRCADPDYGAQGVVVAGLQLPAAAAVCASLGGIALLNSSGSVITAEENRPQRIGGRTLSKTLSVARNRVRRVPSLPRKDWAATRPCQAYPQNAPNRPSHPRT